MIGTKNEEFHLHFIIHTFLAEGDKNGKPVRIIRLAVISCANTTLLKRCIFKLMRSRFDLILTVNTR